MRYFVAGNELPERAAEAQRLLSLRSPRGWPRSAVYRADGALATELERRGADLADPLWSAKCLLEPPDIIRAVHMDYFKAGADVVTTATYQATSRGFDAAESAEARPRCAMPSRLRFARSG